MIKAALTELILAQAKATDKYQKLTDGGGMFLLVSPNGGKYWQIAYRFAGKQKTLSLGVYPKVSLDEARNRRDDARKLMADGIDPGDVQRIRKTVQRVERQALKEAQLADKARKIAAKCFTLDNEGALTFRFGKRHIALTCAETVELRAFLDATQSVTQKVAICL